MTGPTGGFHTSGRVSSSANRTACRLNAELPQLCGQHGRLWPCYDGRPAVARQDQGAEDGEDTDCPTCAVNGGAHKPDCPARDALLAGLNQALRTDAADTVLRDRLEALADDLADIAHRHRHAAPGSYDCGMRRGYLVAAEGIRDALRTGGGR